MDVKATATLSPLESCPGRFRSDFLSVGKHLLGELPFNLPLICMGHNNLIVFLLFMSKNFSHLSDWPTTSFLPLRMYRQTCSKHPDLQCPLVSVTNLYNRLAVFVERPPFLWAHLQVIRQFRAPCVAWVHGDKHVARGQQRKVHALK